MAGFSDVKDGMIDQFKRRMTKAGLTDEMIEGIAVNEKSTIPDGIVALIAATRWHDPVEVHIDGSGRTRSIPGVSVKCEGKRGSFSYFRQHYATPSHTGTDWASLLPGITGPSEIMKVPFVEFKLVSEEWTPFIPGWEATPSILEPLLFYVRRIPQPDRWVEMTPGWEARFSNERRFELRPKV